MIKTVEFINDLFGKSAKRKLSEWSETLSKNQIISISVDNNGHITVFYWED